MTLQKSPRYTNSKLLNLARGMPCAHCGSENGVVAAHSNFAIHGKGKNLKAHDCFIAFLCSKKCHPWLDYDYGVMDGYSSKREEKLRFFIKAMDKTMVLLLRTGKIKLADDINEVYFFPTVDNVSIFLDYWRNGRIRVA